MTDPRTMQEIIGNGASCLAVRYKLDNGYLPMAEATLQWLVSKYDISDIHTLKGVVESMSRICQSHSGAPPQFC